MYWFKEPSRAKEFLNGITRRKLASLLEINENFVSTVLCSKKGCSKLVAYSMSKATNNNMNDYFEKK